MRLVFAGTPRTAVPSLHALIDSGLAPLLVVTRPDRPAGRGRALAAPPIKAAALEAGLEIVQPEKIRDPVFVGRLAACEADWLVVVAYGRILPPSVLELPRGGAVNVHFSLLPRYRGAAPVQWALARGEATTGVTTMRMNERMDEGDVLLRREVAIEPGEHAPALAERLSHVGAALLLETLSRLARQDLESVPQEADAATYAPILRREDGEISPTLEAREIEGRVRGFDPWPGVWLSSRSVRLRLVTARALDAPPVEAPPGTLLELRKDGITMGCGAGTTLLIETVQLAGRGIRSARDAVNGRQIAPGDRLEPIGSAS